MRLHGNTQRGMTLIEIMVVVAILGMLMATVGVHAYARLKTAKITNAKQVVRNVHAALVQYQIENEAVCPKSIDELYERKYLTKEPLDSWGQPLSFKCPGDHDRDGADIVSKGEDQQEGTADDIKSWELDAARRR
jgi:general secretion pathway protein G